MAFASGNMLYVRDRSLLAQPFDLARLEANDLPCPSLRRNWTRIRPSCSRVLCFGNGVLIFQSAADAPTRLVWFDSSGKELGQLSEAGYRSPNFSPDGRFLAVSSTTSAMANTSSGSMTCGADSALA